MLISALVVNDYNSFFGHNRKNDVKLSHKEIVSHNKNAGTAKSWCNMRCQ